MGSSILNRISAILLFLCVVALLPTFAPAQAPGPAPDCLTVLLPLSPCLPYVQGNATAPGKNCCDALAGVVNTNPVCLCTLFGNNTLGIPVNITDAANLPTACNVQTPPLSTCSAVGYPVPANLTSPVVSPAMAPPTLPPSPTATPSATPTTPPTTSPSPLSAPAVSPAPTSTVTPSTSPVPSASPPSPASAVSPSGTPSTTPSTTPSSGTPGVVSSPPALASGPSPGSSGAGSLTTSTALSVVALLVASLRVFQM